MWSALGKTFSPVSPLLSNAVSAVEHSGISPRAILLGYGDVNSLKLMVSSAMTSR